jgi:hypothetical protein
MPCSICNTSGHNKATCPHRNKVDISSTNSSMDTKTEKKPKTPNEKKVKTDEKKVKTEEKKTKTPTKKKTKTEEKKTKTGEKKDPSDMSSNKFLDGENARQKWAKPIVIDNPLHIDAFNERCGNTFQKRCSIKLDYSTKRQSTLTVTNYEKELWDTKKEHIYVITRNGIIVKIGGTRDGMKGRWASYGCGYYVPERKKKNGDHYPGKMSVTNAYLYHTMENDILQTGSHWEFYSWDLPITTIKVEILGKNVEVVAQTFHAYESICIQEFKSMTGTIPLLCDNSDPSYK